MRSRIVLLFTALVLLSVSAHAAGRPRRASAMPSRAPGAATIPWASLPLPDTSGIGKDAHTPTTEDSLAETVLDEGGVYFGPDGAVAALSSKVFLLKSRATARQFQQLQSAPPGPQNSTEAWAVHTNGNREDALSVRDGKITFAPLFPGDLVYIFSRIVQSPVGAGARGGFFISNSFQTPRPVRNARFWVRYPASRPPGLRALSLPQPEVKTEGGMVTKIWARKNLPGLPNEKSAADVMEGVPVVFVDAGADIDWLESVARGYLRLPAGPRLKEVAARLQGASSGKADLLARARAYVADEIKFSPRETTLPDTLRRLTPDGVIRRGSAGTYGKTVLLAGLLRKLGFDAAIALVEPQRMWKLPPIVSPANASPLIAMPSDRPVAWINPMSAVVPPERADLAVQALHARVIGPQKSLPDVQIPVSRNRGVQVGATAVMDSGGAAVGDIRMDFKGDDADLMRQSLLTATKSQAAEVLQQLAFQALMTAETQEAVGEGFEQPGDVVSMSSKLRMRDIVDRSGKSRMVRLPCRIVPELEGANRTTTRNLLRIVGHHEERVDLEVPAGWTAKSAVDSTSGSNRYMRWSDKRVATPGRLSVVRIVDILEPMLPAHDYNMFTAEESRRDLAFDRPVEFLLR